MTNINVGLIGYGFSGATIHAPFISTVKGLTLVRVASSNGEKVKRDLPGVSVASNPAEVIGASDVDVVIVATPNTTHYQLAEQALRAGKHVILEKPFALDATEASALTRLAQERKLMLSVFHNRRWDGDFLTVKHCIESGRLGEVNTYEVHFDRYRPDVRKRWREEDLPGSGTLYDLGAHLIDQVLVLFGMPETVSGDIDFQRVGAVTTDYFHLVLGYGKRRVILHSGSIVRNSGPHFQIHGSLGSYIKYGVDPQEDALRAGKRPNDALWGIEPETLHGALTFERNGAVVTEKIATLRGNWGAYYQGIVDALTNAEPAPVRAEEALDVMRVLDFAIQSSREQRVITVQ